MSSEVRIERPGTLPLNTSKPKSRVTFKNANFQSSKSRDHPHGLHPFKRFRSDSDFRPRRKRTNSCSFSWDRKRQPQIILPTKFLLGGNIGDPLNLEALKEEVATKKEHPSGNNSRGGGAVRVIVPPNINDPLNLDASSEDGEEQLADAIYRQRRRRKTKRRNRRNSEPGGVAPASQPDEKRLSLPTTDELELDTSRITEQNVLVPEVSATPTVLRQMSCPALSDRSKNCQVTPTQPSRSNMSKKCRSKAEDKIVSPVIPQPGVERKKHHLPHQRHPPDKPVRLNQQNAQPPKKFNLEHQLFRYGNYNQYYGYRNPDHSLDPRLKYLKRELFENKTVLDVGCNIGHISLCIARDFGPQKVVGIDIDKKLVKIAQKNTRHYVQESSSHGATFPESMKLLYGPLHPPIDKDAKRCFPHNVSFSQANYVLEDDSLLTTVRPEFDVILCLSVTKWVHLNWGDDGLKRFFKRIFNNLRPGGILILEPQAWPSYTKRRKLSAEIFENYKSIRLFPERFGEYLQRDVGFVNEEKILVHHNFSKGFRRPIFIYKKQGETSPKSPFVDVSPHPAEELNVETSSGKRKDLDAQDSVVPLQPINSSERMNPEVAIHEIQDTHKDEAITCHATNSSDNLSKQTKSLHTSANCKNELEQSSASNNPDIIKLSPHKLCVISSATTAANKTCAIRSPSKISNDKTIISLSPVPHNRDEEASVSCDPAPLTEAVSEIEDSNQCKRLGEEEHHHSQPSKKSKIV